MNTLKHAFEKVNLYPEISQKIELEKAAEQEKLKEENKKKEEEHFKLKNSDRVFSEFVKKVEGYLSSDSGKNFLFHLVCSYGPHIQVIRVMEPTNKKCVFCNKGILSVNEALNLSPEVFREFLQLDLDLIDGKITDNEMYQKKKDLVVSKTNGKLIGVFSKESNIIMCDSCYEMFYKWATNQIINSNTFVINAIKKSVTKINMHQTGALRT